MPRTHRIDASAIAEQFSRGIVDLTYSPTQNQAADVGTKRFEQPPAWAKAIYLVQVVAPKFWTSPDYKSYLDSMFEDGLPLKPGGILKPTLGPRSQIRQGGKLKSKTAHKKKRPGKGKPGITGATGGQAAGAPQAAVAEGATDGQAAGVS